MKRIMAVCGSGLGSSFMVEMNITDVLNELGVSGEYEAAEQKQEEEGRGGLPLHPAGKPDCSCQHEYLCGAGRAGAGRVYRTGQADPENRSQFL